MPTARLGDLPAPGVAATAVRRRSAGLGFDGRAGVGGTHRGPGSRERGDGAPAGAALGAGSGVATAARPLAAASADD